MSYPYQFEGRIVYHDVGSEKYAYTVIFLPDELAADLPLKKYPRLRITGEVRDHQIEASLTPVRGRWYILLSKKLLRAIEASVDDEVEVRFEVADQDTVEIPRALQDALMQNKKVRDLWERQTPGKRRGLAYRVASAKTAATREKRVAEVFAILKGEIDMKGNKLAGSSSASHKRKPMR